MENTIITRENFESKITMIHDTENDVWFKGVDVASILGYSNKQQAIRKHVHGDDNKKMNELIVSQNATLTNSHPHTVFIKESGLYSLILRSKLPEAEKFQRWVTNEVLPSIRKSGSYSVKKEVKAEKLNEIHLKGIQILDTITDVKLKQALRDRIMNEITGEKQVTIEYARDIVTIVKEEFNKNINFTEASKIGKHIVKKYRLKYNKEPKKYDKFVNGNNRSVFCYSKEEEEDLIEWIQEYY